ncbi:hypothetical protein N7512_002897 [Penicillium capsulatum]|nr:hypothetical protein N7512_002897 [Penicillium capsulatum]
MWQRCEPLLSSIIQRARSTYKHELLLGNLAGIPIAQQHGSADDNVPVYHARLMHTILDQIQWPSSYNELPGKGHWFEGVMTTSFLTSFYYAMVDRTKPRFEGTTTSPSRADDPEIMSMGPFTITVPASGNLGSMAGIQVDQLVSPDMNGKLRVHRDPKTHTWHIRTHNIFRFHLTKASPRVDLPATMVLDQLEEPFSVNPAQLDRTWYVKLADGSWDASHDAQWKTLGQRYGHQLGAADAILRTRGTFAISMCSPGVDEVAVQISRNLMQYYAADSRIHEDCLNWLTEHHPGNVFTLAVGEDLPRSKLGNFPIHTHRGGLVVFGNRPSSGLPGSKYEYAYEPGLGAVFLRPLENERLEMVIWGADLAGLQQAARLTPTLTGSGQPEE